MMGVTRLILVACLLPTIFGYYTLKQLSYTQLATGSSRGTYTYAGLNLGAATDAAYDFVNSIVYIIGETSHFMHVVDIADPNNPRVLFIHEFTKGEGVPKSIDICGTDIAVALAAQTDINEGHVRFYHTYTRGSGATDIVLDGYVTVGPHPKHVKYTPDCGTTIVTNEGVAGKDEAGKYTDPEGSVTIIHGERTGNPSVRLVDFAKFNTDQPDYNQNIRTPSLYVPSNILSPLTTVAQDIEPECITISSDGRTAYVTLQENNAIAQVNLYTGVVDLVKHLPDKVWSSIGIDISDQDGGNGTSGTDTCFMLTEACFVVCPMENNALAAVDIGNGVISGLKALPKKPWTSGVDTCDRDGGVHRRMYPDLQSLRQPSAIKSIEIGKKKFLFTADTGAIKSFTNAKHGFTWTDVITAKSLANKIDSTLTALKGEVSNDERLGRLQVSNIDGKNMFNQMFTHLEMFGGRGFSVWDSNNLDAPIFDSEGTLEEYMEAYDKEVFNTDYVASLSYQSPEQTRDSASYRQGAQVTALDIADDNGTMYLVVGTWSTGTLYTYTVDISSGQPVPQFQSVHRSGVTDIPWRDLYQNKTVGDLYISDIGIIPSEHSPTDSPLVYVISTGAGALSLYSIEYETSIIPGPVGR